MFSRIHVFNSPLVSASRVTSAIAGLCLLLLATSIGLAKPRSSVDKYFSRLVSDLSSDETGKRIDAAKALSAYPKNKKMAALKIGEALAQERVEVAAVAMVKGLADIKTPESYKELLLAIGRVNKSKARLKILELTAKVKPGEKELSAIAFDIWTKALSDPHVKVARSAVKIFSRRREPRAYEMILRAANTAKDPRVRAYAVSEATQSKHFRKDTFVKNYWGDKAEEVRLEVLGYMAKGKDKAGAKMVRDALKDKSERVRVEAIRAAGAYYVEDTPVMTDLVALGSREESVEVRSMLLNTLGNFPPTGSIERVLIVNLKSPSMKVRMEAIWPLHHYKESKKAIKALGELKKDRNIAARSLAARTLAAMGTRDAIKRLAPFVFDKEEGVYDPAYEGLSDLGARDAVKSIGKSIEQARDERHKIEGLKALAKIGGAQAVRLIDQALLGNPDPDIRKSSIRVVAQQVLGNNATINALLKRLAVEEEPAIVRLIVKALGQVKSPKVELALARLLGHPDSLVVEAAILALRGARSRKIVPAFNQVIGRQSMQVAAAETLVSIGGSAAAGLVSGFLDHRSRTLRILALSALAGSNAKGDRRDRFASQMVRALEGWKPGSREVLYAVESLGLLGGTQAIDFLKEKLENKETKPKIRGAALIALARLQDKEIIARANAFLKDRSGEVRAGAIRALGITRDPKAIATLLALLPRAAASDQKHLVAALAGNWEAEGVVEALVAGLKKTKIVATQHAILDAMIGKPGKGQPALLTEYISTKQTEPIRIRATKGLMYFKHKEAIPLLLKSLSHRNAKLRKASRQTLEMMTNFTFGSFDAGWDEWWKDYKEKSMDEIVLEGFKTHRIVLQSLTATENRKALTKGLEAFEACCRFNAVHYLRKITGQNHGYDYHPQLNYQGLEAWKQALRKSP